MTGSGFRPIRRLRHGFRLLGQLAGYTVINRRWVLVPLILMLLIVALAVTATEAVAPYTLYPIF